MSTLRRACWTLAALLGAVQAWASRDAMNPDGISYLDVGDAYMRGDWHHALNGYFSPAYSWIVGLVLRVVHPAPAWEFPLVHLVNWVILLGALAAFEFFLVGFLRTGRVTAAGRAAGVSPRAWMALGYALFLWTALLRIGLAIVTPDLLVAVVVYLIAGVLTRLRAGNTHLRTFAVLGALCGLGYLCKTALFVVALVFLMAAALAYGRGAGIGRRLGVAFALFALVAGPFVAALSVTKRRFTFGDAGKLTYAWFVDDLNGGRSFNNVHWQGDGSAFGTPVHPTRKVREAPAVYEFATPIGGTYPPWYDASYWFEGVRIRFAPTTHLKFLFGFTTAEITALLPFLVVWVGVCLTLGAGCLTRASVASTAYLWLPALATFVLYGAVYADSRYYGAFEVLFCLGLFAAVVVPEVRLARRLAGAAAVASAAALLWIVGVGELPQAMGAWHEVRRGALAASAPARVAQAVWAAGVRPGDAVALIGSGAGAYWARLARVHIVAEVPGGEVDRFWRADSVTQRQVIETFAAAGAVAVIAAPQPGAAPDGASGWRPLGGDGHRLRLLRVP